MQQLIVKDYLTGNVYNQVGEENVLYHWLKKEFPAFGGESIYAIITRMNDDKRYCATLELLHDDIILPSNYLEQPIPESKQVIPLETPTSSVSINIDDWKPLRLPYRVVDLLDQHFNNITPFLVWQELKKEYQELPLTSNGAVGWQLAVIGLIGHRKTDNKTLNDIADFTQCRNDEICFALSKRLGWQSSWVFALLTDSRLKTTDGLKFNLLANANLGSQIPPQQYPYEHQLIGKNPYVPFETKKNLYNQSTSECDKGGLIEGMIETPDMQNPQYQGWIVAEIANFVHNEGLLGKLALSPVLTDYTIGWLAMNHNPEIRDLLYRNKSISPERLEKVLPPNYDKQYYRKATGVWGDLARAVRDRYAYKAMTQKLQKSEHDDKHENLYVTSILKRDLDALVRDDLLHTSPQTELLDGNVVIAYPSNDIHKEYLKTQNPDRILVEFTTTLAPQTNQDGRLYWTCHVPVIYRNIVDRNLALEGARNIINSDVLTKSDPIPTSIELHQPLTAFLPEDIPIAAIINTAINNKQTYALDLPGKHSNGTFAAQDVETGKWYLVKPGSGGLSNAAGLREIFASQSRREAIGSAISRVMGLSKFVLHCALLREGERELACFPLIPPNYKNMKQWRQEDPNLPKELLLPYLKNGWIYKWSLFDWIIGNADRNGGNVMMSREGNALLIDHGSTIAGTSFNPGLDNKSFIPYYLRVWDDNFNHREDKLEAMPKIDLTDEIELEKWVNSIDKNELNRICCIYEVSPTELVNRFEDLKRVNVWNHLMKLWVGKEVDV
jgi:hypothetical protein